MGSTPVSRTTFSKRRAKAARRGPDRETKEGSQTKMQGPMDGYHYVYTLESLSNPNQICTGQTQDLKQRLNLHNSGQVPHTSKFTPWQIRSATAFRSGMGTVMAVG